MNLLTIDNTLTLIMRSSCDDKVRVDFFETYLKTQGYAFEFKIKHAVALFEGIESIVAPIMLDTLNPSYKKPIP